MTSFSVQILFARVFEQLCQYFTSALVKKHARLYNRLYWCIQEYNTSHFGF